MKSDDLLDYGGGKLKKDKKSLTKLDSGVKIKSQRCSGADQGELPGPVE